MFDGGNLKSNIKIRLCKCGNMPYYDSQYSDGLWKVRVCCLNCGSTTEKCLDKNKAMKLWNKELCVKNYV